VDSILGCDLCSNHFGSSLLPAVCCVLAPCCSVRMTSFSRARLEGKALEHALAGFDGDGVRMRHDGPKGPWEELLTPQAKAAMKYAKARAPDLRSEFASAGLLVQGADRAVRVGSDTVSGRPGLVQGPRHGGLVGDETYAAEFGSLSQERFEKTGRC